MKSPYIDMLKAAVAQFEEARNDISNCLQWLVEDANITHNCLGRSLNRVTDRETLDRLEYDHMIAEEDMLTIARADEDWSRISWEIEHRFPQIQWSLDEVALDALPYEDFKANEAKCSRDARSDLARGNCDPEQEAVWAQRMAEAAEAGDRIRLVGNPNDLQPIVKEFGPILPANLPEGAFGGIFTDRRVL